MTRRHKVQLKAPRIAARNLDKSKLMVVVIARLAFLPSRNGGNRVTIAAATDAVPGCFLTKIIACCRQSTA